MNFLNQTKLSKQEWTQMETPLTSTKESNILKMINRGYVDETTSYNPYVCLREYLSVDVKMDAFVFDAILRDRILKINKKDVLLMQDFMKTIKSSKKNASKADQIRIQNSMKLFEKGDYDDTIIEFVLLRELKIISKIRQKSESYNTDKKYMVSLYNIYCIYNTYTASLNELFGTIVKHFLATFKKELNVDFMLKHISKFIEHNPALKYNSFSLYSHQKEIIQIFKVEPEKPKFIFYCAPTSSGKTLSPLALSTGYKVLFVCASKHIGLSLAKSAYHLKKRVGFAFGCKDIDHIRLNYNAICCYKENHYKKKIPDHSVGTNVDIMISDLTSFEYAMLYMKAFHKVENTILFWDEPTIGLDEHEHMLHDKMKSIWDLNVIPNVVFSCATLPKQHKIGGIVQQFETKFPGVIHKYIESYDQTTNLMIYDEFGNVLVPHTYFEDHAKMKAFLEYQGPKYFKFYNCNECAKFLLFYKDCIQNDFIENQFQSNIDTMNLSTIKDKYVKCLMQIDPAQWGAIRDHYLSLYPLVNKPNEMIGTELTTKHACSLTNGPTLYVSNQIHNVCKYLLHIAKMNPTLLKSIQEKIKQNNQVSEILLKKRKDYEDKIAKFQDNDKVMEDMRFPPDVLELGREITSLESRIKELHVDSVFQPNTRDHYQKWNSQQELEYDKSDVYSSRVDDESIKNIMQLSTIHDVYKILLLMGIGVFSNEIMPCDEDDPDIRTENNSYLETMKRLAEEKSLYLIVANSDYIYGTNYQFSHCYLGKDMKNMSQEKVIQCIGRIGRQDRNKHFSFRFRSKEQMELLYQIPEGSIEADNMNKLFC